MGPRTGLEECRKSRLQQDSIPGPSERTETLHRLRFPGAHLRGTPLRTADLHYFPLVQTAELTDTKELCSEFPQAVA